MSIRKLIFMKNKDLDQELDELIHFEERGGGFGAPEALRSHERKIDAIKHQQLLELEKKNTTLSWINTIAAIFNIGLVAYQVFFVTCN